MKKKTKNTYKVVAVSTNVSFVDLDHDAFINLNDENKVDDYDLSLVNLSLKDAEEVLRAFADAIKAHLKKAA
jgi:hypothetical protein